MGLKGILWGRFVLKIKEFLTIMTNFALCLYWDDGRRRYRIRCKYEVVLMTDSSAGISIGLYDFIVYYESFGDLLEIFSPDDRRIREQIKYGRSCTQYAYVTTVERAKKCLDCMGYTIEAANEVFEISKQQIIDHFESYFIEESDDLNREMLKREYSFHQWRKAAERYALKLAQEYSMSDDSLSEEYRRKDLSVAEKIVLKLLDLTNPNFYFGIYHGSSSRWTIFRVLIDAFESNQEIILDYTKLYRGGYGWCREEPEHSGFVVPKTIILTEGSYDSEVILKSMQLLYPYMTKYYSFLNFSASNVQGGASFTTHYVKAFIGAGIQNRVIALYDNDTAGRVELECFKNIKLPENFRVMTLPDISLAENYPTVGPTKDESIDINGKACSIELYLGRDVLTEQNRLIPIMWKGYKEQIKAYQGEIKNKSEIQKKFKQKLKDAAKNGIQSPIYWAEIDILLNSLFYAFT